MAVKDSGEIATNSNYTLGNYSFRIERSSVPGSSNDKIEAICTDKDGKNARKSIQIRSSTKVNGWYVEANETEATVYVLLEGKTHSDSGSIPDDNIFGLVGFDYTSSSVITSNGGALTCTTGAKAFTYGSLGGSGSSFLFASDSSFHSTFDINPDVPISIRTDQYGTYTYDDKTVYYEYVRSGANGFNNVVPSVERPNDSLAYYRNPQFGQAAWLMIYNEDGPEGIYELLVGRFSIKLEDAGGVGPGSDWSDPGDYDPDWEEGDPTHTLYVEVTGALSGRHNDPIVDPSYSYIPADKDTVKDYGCGGDGGHGGGGGAGASTVVIHKFATNQANSKEVTALARRHGYGSGGGKGGKGGDGCILVYY